MRSTRARCSRQLARKRSAGAATYRKELAWREFYADVLFHQPRTAREYLRPEFARMPYDPPGAQLEAWQEGRTGFPIVDAGMRQLRATGWMHNRVRMVAASFLVKDLHVEWQHGARHFMRWLVDGDLASNQHGWQWTAGCGTDAAPYFRVFNPTTQGRKFDPDGRYVRQWVEELRDPDRVPDPHDPDADTRGLVGYPAPIVDHREERLEALDRWEAILIRGLTKVGGSRHGVRGPGAAAARRALAWPREPGQPNGHQRRHRARDRRPVPGPGQVRQRRLHLRGARRAGTV